MAKRTLREGRHRQLFHRVPWLKKDLVLLQLIIRLLAEPSALGIHQIEIFKKFWGLTKAEPLSRAKIDRVPGYRRSVRSKRRWSALVSKRVLKILNDPTQRERFMSLRAEKGDQ